MDPSLKEKRKTGVIPSDAELRDLLRKHDRRTERSRIARIRYFNRYFGAPRDMLLMGGISSYYALVELELCYVQGAYLGTILCCQAFAENVLGGQLILMMEDQAAEAGFSAIVQRAVARKIIDKKMSEKLIELNKMRISYGHVHVGLRSRSHMKRILDGGLDPMKLLIRDSKKAIKTIAQLIN